MDRTMKNSGNVLNELGIMCNPINDSLTENFHVSHNCIYVHLIFFELESYAHYNSRPATAGFLW